MQKRKEKWIQTMVMVRLDWKVSPTGMEHFVCISSWNQVWSHGYIHHSSREVGNLDSNAFILYIPIPLSFLHFQSQAQKIGPVVGVMHAVPFPQFLNTKPC
jgi:hypothetical protein